MAWLERGLSGKVFKVGAKVRHRSVRGERGDILIGRVIERRDDRLGKRYWRVRWENAFWTGSDNTAVDPEDQLELVDD